MDKTSNSSSRGLESRYDDSVARFYAAGTGRGSWSDACNALAQLIDAWCLQITGLDRRTGAVRFSWDGGFAPAQAWLDYFTHYHRINPRVPLGLELKVGAWQHDHEILPQPVIEQDPFFKDFLVPYGGCYCSATKLLEDDEIVVILAAIAHSQRPPLTESEISLLERFRTHLIQSIHVYRTLQRGHTESLIARRMLDALAQPVLLIDDTQYIHHANAAALELLELAGVMSERRGTLRFQRARDSGRLNAALRQLGLTGNLAHGDMSSQVVFRVSDRTGEDSHLVVAIAARPDESMAVFGASPRAILLFHPLKGRPTVDPLIAGHAFGLTPAEARVASAIVAGESVAGIAAARSLSVETIRSQLRSIFLKVGVTRQSDLARVLSVLPQTNLQNSTTLIIR